MQKKECVELVQFHNLKKFCLQRRESMMGNCEDASRIISNSLTFEILKLFCLFLSSQFCLQLLGFMSPKFEMQFLPLQMI